MMEKLNIMVVGGGGREHALAWKISRSPMCGSLVIAPGNAGTAECGRNIPISADNCEAIISYAKDNKIELVVVGPEDPLAAGLVDRLQAEGIMAFGPSAAAARVESDKAFAKQLMRQHAIPTAEARIFSRFSDAKAYIASRDEPVVVKAAGLAKGKGVFVCDDPADGILAAEKIMVQKIFGSAGDTVVVEEKLEGEEASILAFVDGQTIYVMESSQDHKPIGEGDTGPNTGGMGAYSPTPAVTEETMSQIQRHILVPLIDGMHRAGITYRGVLYAGLIITPGGPKVLEFNVRFGDPETQPLLMRLQSDILEPILAVCRRKLDEVSLRWDPRPAVCVVMASGGYPGAYEKGFPIHGLDDVGEMNDVMVFHAGTKLQNHKVLTNGGRVLGVTALGNDIADAQQRAYEATGKIHFENAYYRRDIAQRAITRKH